MVTELSFSHEFRSIHSLTGFERPHVHRYEVQVILKFSDTAVTSRTVDLVDAVSKLKVVCNDLRGKNLNEHKEFAKEPTTEHIAEYLYLKLLKLYPWPVSKLNVIIKSSDGTPWGAASVSS